MEEQNKDQEYAFIKEKIKDKPINKRQLWMKLGWVALSAVIFGFLSCLVFVIMKPKLEARIYPPEDPAISIPKDQLPEDEPEVKEPEIEPEQTETQPETVIVNKELQITDFQSLQNMIYSVGKKVNKSIVTVTARTSRVDWFDSPQESENQASGIIINNNGQELLILTEKKAVADAQSIYVTFTNDDRVPAALRKYDGNTGIAIISVDIGTVSEETLGKIEEAVLGNSLTVNQGTVVMAIGSPQGINYSIMHGVVTSSGTTVSLWDNTYKIFYTDMIRSPKDSGVLINMNGEVVGLIAQSIEGNHSTIAAFSISELKEIIEDLSNGVDIPFLGLNLGTVNDEIAEEANMPKGVYIKKVKIDSPAMAANLMEADVIVEMNGEEILTVEQFNQKLHSLKPEQNVSIKVMRLSGEEYVPLDHTAVIGVHQ